MIPSLSPSFAAATAATVPISQRCPCSHLQPGRLPSQQLQKHSKTSPQTRGPHAVQRSLFTCSRMHIREHSLTTIRRSLQPCLDPKHPLQALYCSIVQGYVTEPLCRKTRLARKIPDRAQPLKGSLEPKILVGSNSSCLKNLSILLWGRGAAKDRGVKHFFVSSKQPLSLTFLYC